MREAMETLLRPAGRREQKLFFLCLFVSVGIHLLLAWMALPERAARETPRTTRLAERYGRAVNAVTDFDARGRARVESVLSKLEAKRWTREELADTLQWAASDLALDVHDGDVVRALDPERSREGRWDVRIWLRWGDRRGIEDFLVLAYLIGEGTLKSDFGSHRFWVHIEADGGSGQVAFETMDCRLYRAGRLPASDLLHRNSWRDR
jgi:hypothetical protein